MVCDLCKGKQRQTPASPHEPARPLCFQPANRSSLSLATALPLLNLALSSRLACLWPSWKTAPGMTKLLFVLSHRPLLDWQANNRRLISAKQPEGHLAKHLFPSQVHTSDRLVKLTVTIRWTKTFATCRWNTRQVQHNGTWVTSPDITERVYLLAYSGEVFIRSKYSFIFLKCHCSHWNVLKKTQLLCN